MYLLRKFLSPLGCLCSIFSPNEPNGRDLGSNSFALSAMEPIRSGRAGHLLKMVCSFACSTKRVTSQTWELLMMRMGKLRLGVRNLGRHHYTSGDGIEESKVSPLGPLHNTTVMANLSLSKSDGPPYCYCGRSSGYPSCSELRCISASPKVVLFPLAAAVLMPLVCAPDWMDTSVTSRGLFTLRQRDGTGGLQVGWLLLPRGKLCTGTRTAT